jgi:phage shock protein PspC (stress-responsive transcriptional regulator)
MAPSTADMTDSEPDAPIEPPVGDPLPPPTAPASAAAPLRPPLRRAIHNKEWLGVAEGLSRYLGVAVGFVRLAFVITTFLGGLGIVVYLLAAALVPKEGESNALGERLTGGRSEVLLILIGALALTVVGIVNDGDSDLALVGVLAIAGLALWAQSTGRLTAETFARGTDDASTTPQSMYAPWTAAPSVPQPPKVRKSARLGLATLAAAAVTMIVLAPWSSPWRVVLFGFAVLAIGFLVGWILRKRVWFLVLPMLALVPVLPTAAFYSRSGVPLNAGTGELNLTTADLSGSTTTRRLSAGHITFDLSTLAESRSVNAAVGAGQIDITVPRTARVVVRARTGAGSLRIFGTETEGIGVSADRTIEGSEGAIVIEIDAKVGMGLVAIHRVGDQS